MSVSTISSSENNRSYILLGFIALCFILAMQKSYLPIANFTNNLVPINTTSPALFTSEFASTNPGNFVHAASIAELGNGNLIAVWFAGSREGGKDVTVKATRFDAKKQSWSDEFILATPWGTQAATQRWVKKLGNPVITLAPNGRLWLFYVSVAAGGWAASAINSSYSDDLGATWSQAERLITTPFLNISTLVKGTPLYYEDGTMALPVYHEFMGKFAELLRIDQQGKVVSKTRITHKKYSLQPVILPSIGKHPTLALMRNAGSDKMLLASISDDNGESWQASEHQPIPNPNSALAAMRRPDDSIIAILNNTKDGRNQLALAYCTENGKGWKVLKMLEQRGPERISKQQYTPILKTDFFASQQSDVINNTQAIWSKFETAIDRRMCKKDKCKFSYDYPYLIQDKDGTYHVVYSWNKSFIKHLSFNNSWLEQQL